MDAESCIVKPCGICKASKPLDAFCRNKNRKDGLAWDCRACRKARAKPRCPIKTKASRRAYYLRHREERIAITVACARRRREADPDGYLDKKLSAYQALRLAVIAKLGGACVRCGFGDEMALQVDHVHGGGNRERTGNGGHEKYYRAILRHGDRGMYQVLCANCNWIKRSESYGERSGKMRASERSG